jgi:hypothetical protein
MANNLPAYIGVGIALDQAFGAMPVVFPHTLMCHFIGLRCGMESSLNGWTSSHIG